MRIYRVRPTEKRNTDTDSSYQLSCPRNNKTYVQKICVYYAHGLPVDAAEEMVCYDLVYPIFSKTNGFIS